jgi:hypothetical protein
MGDVIPINGPLRLKLKDRGRVCRAIVKGEEFKAGNMTGERLVVKPTFEGKTVDYQVKTSTSPLSVTGHGTTTISMMS